MEKNNRSISFCIVLIIFSVNNSFKCALIEMKTIEKASIEKVFVKHLFSIADQLKEHPTTIIKNFSLINKECYETIHAVILQIIALVSDAKKYREKYDCTELRKNWLVNQMHLLDTTLAFTMLKEKRKKAIVYTNSTSQNNIACISKCINYLSVKTNLPVYTLSHLFACLKYLKYYTFLYKDRFNLYDPYGQCTLL